MTGRRWWARVRWDAVVRALAFAAPDYALAPPVPVLSHLTDAALCELWASAAPDEQARCLREMARRNPAGLSTWLLADPGSAPDPLPFLVRQRRLEPMVDWDSLIP